MIAAEQEAWEEERLAAALQMWHDELIEQDQRGCKKAALRMKLPRHLGLGGLIKKVAESTQLKTKDVNSVIDCLYTIAYAEKKNHRQVVIPGLTTLKLKRKPAKAGTKVMFAGKPGTKVMFGKHLNEAASTLPQDTL